MIHQCNMRIYVFGSCIIMIASYYQVLQLTRHASSSQIAENYRKLALRYHPKNTRDTPEVSAHIFSQLAEAYQVLSDPVKRAFYDKYGLQKLKEGLFEGGQLLGGYRYANNPDQIFDEFFKNSEKQSMVLDLKPIVSGSILGHAFGGLEHNKSFVNEDLIVPVTCTLEELYQGAERTVNFQRKTLNEDGRTTRMADCIETVHIKPGYAAGTLLARQGQGHQSVHRTVSNLYFKVEEILHGNYIRKGDDLIYTHRLELADALACSSITVPTLDGRNLSTALDQIVTPQELHEVAHEGMVNQQTGKRGSLYIRFDISFPTELPQSTRAQLRSLL